MNLSSLTSGAVLVLAIIAYLLGDAYFDEVKRHGMTTAQLEKTVNELDIYKAGLLEAQNAMVAFESEKLANTTEFNKVSRELQGLKNREATVLAKTGLVTLKINKSFKASQERLACITGDDTLCTKD